MERLALLRKEIETLYSQERAGRADWCDWLFRNHIFAVSVEAGTLARRFGANEELAMAAAMLHDIADAVMSRFDPCHETESMLIAKDLLEKCHFSEEEIRIVVDDAIRFHGCHSPEDMPTSLEGKIMATADAIVHLNPKYYGFCTDTLRKEKKSLLRKSSLGL